MKGLRATAALLLILWPLTALTSTPESLSYQGYLTDRNGSPQNGDLLTTFSIYAVEVGGTFQWQDVMLVEVENGLMSVELGRPANPFPPDLFQTPLWLGIQVETDTEMVPRRALTSVGFSFKAKDADSLQGKSSADLDQSVHAGDLTNPHVVTAAQVGAADQATLNAHTADLSNPHQTIASQTGAADAALFSSHTADSAAHHTRYADAEAVNAMGAPTPSNPLNHDRVTPSEILTAILDQDGPGSELDADTLDGVESNALQADIANNTAAIQQNTEAIAMFRVAPVVLSDGQEIGLFLSLISDSMWLLSSTNYMFALRPSGEIIIEELGFTEPACQGQAYAVYLSINVEAAALFGWVLQAGGAQLFYAPPGTTSQYVNQQSLLQRDGTCRSEGDGTTAFPVFPNDPSATGVSQTTFAPPITIGP